MKSLSLESPQNSHAPWAKADRRIESQQRHKCNLQRDCEVFAEQFDTDVETCLEGLMPTPIVAKRWNIVSIDQQICEPFVAGALTLLISLDGWKQQSMKSVYVSILLND